MEKETGTRVSKRAAYAGEDCGGMMRRCRLGSGGRRSDRQSGDTMRPIYALLLSLMLAGCAASSHIVTGTKRSPIDPAQVRLYSQPPAKFEEVAIIEASSRNSWAIGDQGKIDVVVERLKEQAAQLGANGVLLQMTGTESTGGVVTGFSSGSKPTFGTGIYTQALHKVGKALAIYVPK
jgi:hypothetical protein